MSGAGEVAPVAVAVALPKPLFDLAQQILLRRDRQAEIDRRVPELWVERDRLDREVDDLLDLWCAERARV